jgi:hypothetical protein
MTMKAAHIFPLICLLWVCSNSMSRGLAAEYYHVWKLDAAYDKPIPDPEQWAADNFSDAPNAAKDDWKIERFELDLNHDGVPEVFLTTPRLHGTGGGTHLVFQKRGEFYFYGGQISGRKHTIRVLPVEADGRPRIMTFWSDGGGRGTASVWKWDGKAFQAISSEAIWSSDNGTEEGRRRFEELFGKKGIEPSGAAVAPSIYGPAVRVTELDSERPLDLSLIPAKVAIRVALSVQEPLELPSLPTGQLPRVVHRPEFLIDGRVQSLPK